MQTFLSQSVACLSILLTGVLFVRTKAFNFGVRSKNSLSNPSPKISSSGFFGNVYNFAFHI